MTPDLKSSNNILEYRERLLRAYAREVKGATDWQQENIKILAFFFANATDEQIQTIKNRLRDVELEG